MTAARTRSTTTPAPKKSIGKAVGKKASTPTLTITLDQRTATMPLRVLKCRGRVHPWQEVPTESTRRTELATLRQIEVSELCVRCKSTRKTIYNKVTGMTVYKPEIVYSDDYLIAKEFAGSGRLPKAEARKAWLATEYPEL